MRTISSLPPELTDLLFDAGTRIIVLVEGNDDQYVLRKWFKEFLSEVEFYACGGIINLNKLLEELLNRGTLKRAYGIADRDFRSAAEVDNSYLLLTANAFCIGSTVTSSKQNTIIYSGS